MKKSIPHCLLTSKPTNIFNKNLFLFCRRIGANFSPDSNKTALLLENAMLWIEESFFFS